MNQTPHEFLITNGLGGYCSSSIYDGNTRKYHGLLVVADAELNRFVTLNRLEERVNIEDEIYELSQNQYAPDVVHPKGSKWCEAFECESFACWRYTLPRNIQIEKKLNILEGSNTVVIEYLIQTTAPIQLTLQPLITYRDIYDLGNTSVWKEQVIRKQKTTVQYRNEAITLSCRVDCSEIVGYQSKPDTFHNFHYPIDHINGDFGTESLYAPGYFEIQIPAGKQQLRFICNADKDDVNSLQEISQGELSQKIFEIATNKKYTSPHPLKKFHKKLIQASKDFVIYHENQYKVIAGYHFFKDWGRDTMISFKGLFLIPEKYQEGKMLLLAFAQKIKNGLIPNRVTGIEDYHTIDASLWFVVACYQYFDATKDTAFLQKIFPSIQSIIEHYKNGSLYGIHMDTDGCICWTQPEENLTWMDGQVNGVPVLDRSGKAVEIQALWYNALKITADFSLIQNNLEQAEKYTQLSDLFIKNFESIFWHEEKQCLYDVVKKDGNDASLRPNQLYCMSLPYPLLSIEKAQKVLDTCTKHLLTPVGLKTLAENEFGYAKKYRGSQPDRDRAYHNGTVWPFLLGAYFLAHIKHHNYSPESIETSIEYYQVFANTLSHQCINQISEIYEADTLEPRGCCAQAWSVACNLEVVDALIKRYN